MFPICEGCESVEQKVARERRSTDKMASERVNVENRDWDCTSLFLFTPEAKMNGDQAQIERTICLSLLRRQ